MLQILRLPMSYHIAKKNKNLQTLSTELNRR